MTFSRNWLEQSEAAKAEGVCHTREECLQMYSEIPEKKKEKAIEAFRESKYFEEAPSIKEEIAKDPEHWNVPYHLWWGMAVRNFFRKEAMGEKYFGVDNLDCIYKYLVEDAVK